jgi:UPF0755 protein
MSEQGLALPFEDEADTRRSRRQRREKRKRDRRRAATAMVLVLTIFVLLAGGVWYGVEKVGSLLAAPDYPGPGSGRVIVQISDGNTATDIAATLKEKGVVESTKAFVEAATADKRSLGLQPGSYAVKREMKASDALLLLLDPASRVTMRFTVPEGLTARQAYERIAQQTDLSARDLAAAAKNPAGLGLPGWAKGDVEGFLFPDTYNLSPDADAKAALTAMVARSLEVLTEIDFLNRAQAVNLDPMEALKVASLLEGEGIPSDFGKIARVVYNRLKDGMALQFDSTTIYGREKRGIARDSVKLTRAELQDPTDPYSTYGNKDLPPTPISNPGKAALEAAIAPAHGNWLFFVLVSPDGHSAFTADFAEHERNIQKCRAIGRC